MAVIVDHKKTFHFQVTPLPHKKKYKIKNNCFYVQVKYTLPVRSLSVVRQKGEEYRAHGRNGWLWLSSTRVFNPKVNQELTTQTDDYTYS